MESNDITFKVGLNHSARQTFGNKACNLQICSNLGFRVPVSFSVSARLCDRIFSTNSKQKYIKLFYPWVEELLSLSPNAKFVVRSSSSLEDQAGSLFSGMFDSYLNVQTSEDIVFAIEKIIASSRRSSLGAYFDRYGKDIASVHMAVCVQEQIIPEYSGFFEISENEVLFEYVNGHLSGVAQGKETVKALRVNLDSGQMCVLRGEIPPSLMMAISTLMSSTAVRDLAKHYPSVACEFASIDQQIIILQMKTSPLIHDGTEKLCREPVPEDNLRQYLSKADSMDFFRNSDLFSKGLRIYRSGTPLKTIIRGTIAFLKEFGPITVRFSAGNELGLPRAFLKTEDEIRRFLRSRYQKCFDVIIHEYIDVGRSVEILINRDGSVLLEHVPGMWESSSGLQPDVVELLDNHITAYRYLGKRTPVFGNKVDWDEGISRPLSDEMFQDIAFFLKRVRQAFRASHEIDLPINVHAVWEKSSREFQCLNIRPGFIRNRRLILDHEPYKVRKKSDLQNWDGVSAIRLALRTTRGHESGLITLAKELTELNVPLIADFGILSHPAMVLREFGCVLHPSYEVVGISHNGEYQKISFFVDEGNDPYNRILKENSQIDNDIYHVVDDIECIGTRHLLAVAKSASPSTKDTDRIDAVVRVLESPEVSKADGHAFYFERGRASFCTSGFTTPQDHFHLIWGIDNERTVRVLREKLRNVNCFQSLESAYSCIEPIGAYCLFGSSDVGYFVFQGSVVPKKLLRSSVIHLEMLPNG